MHRLSNWFQQIFAPLPHHGAEYFIKIAIGMLVVFGLLGVLQAAPKQYRRGIIAAFTFLGGLYYFLEFFLPASPVTHKNVLSGYMDIAGSLSAVVSAFAMGIGVISLFQLHIKKLVRLRAGWVNSLALIGFCIAMFVFTLLNSYAPTKKIFNFTAHDAFEFLFTGGLGNLGAATFALIAFYIASASYRAFRIRSLESTLLMGAALVVMLGSTTLGTALTSWLPANGPAANFRFENITEWLLTCVNSPAQRGILFGLELGLLATSLRLWLSLEPGAYFDKEI